jgi:hypothetical protein
MVDTTPLWLGVANIVVTLILFALSFLHTWSRDNRADKLEREKKRGDLAKKWSETYHDQHSKLIRIVETLGGQRNSNVGQVTGHEGFAQNYWKKFGGEEAAVNAARGSIVRFWELLYRSWVLVYGFGSWCIGVGYWCIGFGSCCMHMIWGMGNFSGQWAITVGRIGHGYFTTF